LNPDPYSLQTSPAQPSVISSSKVKVPYTTQPEQPAVTFR
jgi:hypothetical protein